MSRRTSPRRAELHESASYLLTCLREPTGLVLPALLQTAAAPAGLAELAARHHVLTTIAVQARSIADPALRNATSRARREQAGRMLTVASDLRQLDELLSPFPWFAVKGPAAAQSLYRDPVLRHYADLDILVPGRVLEPVLDVLEGHGFQLLDRNWPLLASRCSGEIGLLTPRGNALDLHWHVINDRRHRAVLDVDHEELMEGSRRLAVNGVSFPALSAEAQLVHLAVHAFVSGGRRLSWLKDLQLATAAGPDWPRVLWLCRRPGLGAATGAVLWRAHQVLGTATPPDVLDALLPAWRLPLRLLDTFRPPALAEGVCDGLTGTELLWSVRRTRSASAQALLAAVASRVRAGARSPMSSEEPGRLQLDVADPASRARWLRRAAGEAAVDGRPL